MCRDQNDKLGSRKTPINFVRNKNKKKQENNHKKETNADIAGRYIRLKKSFVQHMERHSYNKHASAKMVIEQSF